MIWELSTVGIVEIFCLALFLSLSWEVLYQSRHLQRAPGVPNVGHFEKEMPPSCLQLRGGGPLPSPSPLACPWTHITGKGNLEVFQGNCKYPVSSSRWRCRTCSSYDYLFSSSPLFLALVYELTHEMASSWPFFNVQKWQFCKVQYILHKEMIE